MPRARTFERIPTPKGTGDEKSKMKAFMQIYSIYQKKVKMVDKQLWMQSVLTGNPVSHSYNQK